jgi:hypothetical protein
MAMPKFTRSVRLITWAGLITAGLLLASCENNTNVQYGDEPPDSLNVTPVYTVLKTNDMVVSLTVGGGDPPFFWTISDTTLGSLSPTSSVTRVVNYTRVDGVAGVNIITVADGNNLTASATVDQDNETE